ncbi:hypothetical protein PROPEN_01472 [Proteus penneri ATCC 35198]|nr:hypothetical protein PROPEN_01472 [Proteus penneri ATCC 35198]
MVTSEKQNLPKNSDVSIKKNSELLFALEEKPPLPQTLFCCLPTSFSYVCRGYHACDPYLPSIRITCTRYSTHY